MLKNLKLPQMPQTFMDCTEFVEFLLQFTLISVSVFFFCHVFTTITASITIAVFIIIILNLYQMLHI